MVRQAVETFLRQEAPGDRTRNTIGAGPAQYDADLIAGIAAYRRHPWQRDLTDPACLWADGDTRLLDYGPADGRPVLFVPSLINRAYVLDLMRGHSMLRFLSAHGVRPLLLDWGWPGEVERRFNLTDYVVGRLERALVQAGGLVGQRPVLAGYCMGGTLAVAAAERRPELISGLVLLAAPWDFHAPDPQRGDLATAVLPLLEPALGFSRTLSVDLLQALFTLLDPWGVIDKFRAFRHLPSDNDRSRLFVALEDWLNDGVPLAAEVARACLRDWYGANTPQRGQWRIAGQPIDPRNIASPAFVAIPGRDRIVPPDSALPLAKLIPRAALHRPAGGHIGMAAGAHAETLLWRPLLDWLRTLDAPTPGPPRQKRRK